MDGKVSASKKRTKHHFNLAVENIRADLTCGNSGRIERYEHRIARLEAHVDLTA